jgi:opacity protein-like surface antigen
MKTTPSLFKICMVAAPLLLALSTAPAQAYPNSNSNVTPGSGFYLGGYGGWTWTDASGFSVDGGDWGVLGGFDLGSYLNRNSNMGLDVGLELHYGWSSADDTVGAVKVKKGNEWGVDLHPGFSVISNAMPLGLKPYAILGYRQTEFDTERATGTNEDTFHGFALGAGAEVLAWGHAGVRLDYTHVWYGSHNGLDPDEDNLRGALVFHF